jgi:PAS domain S-box-containing protein
MSTFTTTLTSANDCNNVHDCFIPFNNHISSDQENMEAVLASYLQIMNRAALVSVADLKGNIIYANELFCKVSKYSIEELLNKPHSIVRHPDTSPLLFKDMWATIGKGNVWQGELKNITKDGSEYWVFATVAPVMGKNSKPVSYISVRYDISNHKLTEGQLKTIKTKADYVLLENIEYAKNMHSKFLSNDDGTSNAANDSFLIYKAQKIISGDFYKIERNGNKIMLVLGDSTGHGFSASYISVLTLNILTRVMESCKNNPSKLLKKVNAELNRITHYNQKKQLTESADMIVCCIDKDAMKLTYASAKMKGFIVRYREVILLEKENYTIGEVASKDFKITNKTIQLEKDDCLYLISDGATDQFGGVADKKIGFKTIATVLKEIQSCRMSLQKTIIEKMLQTWQGEREQTDDITIFGIKI